MVMPVVFRQFGECEGGTIAIRLDGKGLDHWRGVVWGPGIVGQQCAYMCVVIASI